MIGKEDSKIFADGLTLGTAVGVIMLSMFYGQYRWLANEIVTTRQATRCDPVRSFERRMRAQLHMMADEIALEIGAPDSSSVYDTLNRLITDNATLAGLRFSGTNVAPVQSGDIATVPSGDTVAWLADVLIMSYPVSRDDTQLGELLGAFRLDRLHAESASFANDLVDTELQNRRTSYFWIGLGTLATLLVFGSFVGLIVRRQTARVRALKLQAEKLRDADFGEPLLQTHGDELGELAAVFNDMRDRLRSTTISRDYVDSILSGMNEAIIVTSDDGIIKRINRATTILLGYDDEELLGKSIEFIVDTNKTPALVDNSSTGVPKEAFFESKFGESIPVSYTCSVVAGHDGESADRIYAAQNITERRRAERRIRYLARYDALTKIPNRMQFQHLLQRSIARARRSGSSLCMFYVDIDHFKEINDTFGHLAGDTTLETVAERLVTALPENSIIGRLAGDEFAIIVNDLGSTGGDKIETNKLAK